MVESLVLDLIMPFQKAYGHLAVLTLPLPVILLLPGHTVNESANPKSAAA